jgi:hypothetical protein
LRAGRAKWLALEPFFSQDGAAASQSIARAKTHFPRSEVLFYDEMKKELLLSSRRKS